MLLGAIAVGLGAAFRRPWLTWIGGAYFAVSAIAYVVAVDRVAGERKADA